MPGDSKEEILPLDVIFSCSVCQATFSEVYANSEYDKGFRDDSRPEEDQQVTNLWLTKCGHLTCTKHLDGGGVPFHRAGDHPQAVCPVCASERNDTQKKVLYAIRGSADGQHDSAIPKNWFDAPPMNLDGRGKDMDALRFHYLSLVRFGTKLLPRLRSCEAIAENFKAQAAAETTRCKSLSEQLENSNSRLQELENCEEELNRWRERESKIRFYLGLFVQITKENAKLREQLTAMGYAVPSRTYSTDPEAHLDQEPQASSSHHDPNTATRYRHQGDDAFELLTAPRQAENLRTASDRTLSGPAEPIPRFRADPNQPQATIKHARNELSHIDSHEFELNPPKMPRVESRHLMPPPPPPPNANHRASSMRQYSVPGPMELEENDVPLLDSGPCFASSNEAVPTPLVMRTSRPTNDFSRVSSPQHLRNEHAYEHAAARNGSKNLLRSDLAEIPSGCSPRRSQAPKVYMSGALGNPLHEQSDSRTDMQQSRYDSNQVGIQDYHGQTPRQSQQRQPIYRSSHVPNTPSPTKYSGPLAGDQSVISPFFSRGSATQHAGRMTLPHKSSTQQQATGYNLQTRLRHLRSRTGTSAARNVIYPQSSPCGPKAARPPAARQRFTPLQPQYTNNGSLQWSPTRQDNYNVQPPSSPYFHQVQPGDTLQQTRVQHHSSEIPHSQLSSRQITAQRYARAAYRPRGESFTTRPMQFQSEVGQPPYFDDYVNDHEYPERVGTSTGLKSGVSRLSSEWAREAREPASQSRSLGRLNPANELGTSRIHRTMRW